MDFVTNYILNYMKNQICCDNQITLEVLARLAVQPRPLASLFIEAGCLSLVNYWSAASAAHTTSTRVAGRCQVARLCSARTVHPTEMLSSQHLLASPGSPPQVLQVPGEQAGCDLLVVQHFAPVRPLQTWSSEC